MPVPVVGATAAIIDFTKQGKSSEMTSFISIKTVDNQYGF